jgi:hypothetical protein
MKSSEPAAIIRDMLDSIKSIKTLRLQINAIEREAKNFNVVSSEIKLQVNPRKLYFINRKKKLEILYVQGQNNNKALVKSGVVPNIHLDPTGNIMRKNQHYTIHEIGFEALARAVNLTLSKDKDGSKNFVYKGKVKKLSYNCYMLQYDNAAFGFTDYTVGVNETATSIAYKLRLNDYLVRYKNDLLNDFGYIKSGTKLKVPTLYCKRAVIYVDEKSMLPVSASLYDDEGLFESYEFPSMEINPVIKEEEFTKSYPGYGFN